MSGLQRKTKVFRSKWLSSGIMPCPSVLRMSSPWAASFFESMCMRLHRGSLGPKALAQELSTPPRDFPIETQGHSSFLSLPELRKTSGIDLKHRPHGCWDSPVSGNLMRLNTYFNFKKGVRMAGYEERIKILLTPIMEDRLPL